MKKTFIKIGITILSVIVFLVAQYHIRQYYGIDPRIWFFVVLGISIIGYIAIWIGFLPEILRIEKYLKTHSFFDFIEAIPKKTVKMLKMIKPAIERIVHSIPYMLLNIIALLSAFTGVMYKLFFHDDFMARSTIYIIYLIMIACVLIGKILNSIVAEKSKRKNELFLAGMWSFMFLTNFLEFVI